MALGHGSTGLTDDDLALRGSDLVLLMLAAPTNVPSAANRINGVTRLEKLLFLAEEEENVGDVVVQDKLNFEAYDYGPFAKGVYEAVELLEASNFVKEERRVNGRTIDSLEDANVTGAVEGDEYIERCFTLTEQGQAVARLLSGEHPQTVRALSAIKDRYANRSLSALIKYVYTNYPDLTVNSKIADQVL